MRILRSLPSLSLHRCPPSISPQLVSTTSNIRIISHIYILASNCIADCIQLHPPHCIDLSFIASNCSVALVFSIWHFPPRTHPTALLVLLASTALFSVHTLVS